MCSKKRQRRGKKSQPQGVESACRKRRLGIWTFLELRMRCALPVASKSPPPRAWSLVLGASLDLGAWTLELFSGELRIGTSPAREIFAEHFHSLTACFLQLDSVTSSETERPRTCPHCRPPLRRAKHS